MHRARLLERVAAREACATAPTRRSLEQATPGLLRSVVVHLGRVLNTRRGSVPIDPEFGMRDLGNLDAGDVSLGIAELEAQLQSMIERYEPRLLRPRVRLREEQSDALCLRFDLEASILREGRELPWCLATRIDARGRVRIDGTPD
jgi:type VI secretion system protein